MRGPSILAGIQQFSHEPWDASLPKHQFWPANNRGHLTRWKFRLEWDQWRYPFTRERVPKNPKFRLSGWDRHGTHSVPRNSLSGSLAFPVSRSRNTARTSAPNSSIILQPVPIVSAYVVTRTTALAIYAHQRRCKREGTKQRRPIRCTTVPPRFPATPNLFC